MKQKKKKTTAVYSKVRVILTVRFPDGRVGQDEMPKCREGFAISRLNLMMFQSTHCKNFLFIYIHCKFVHFNQNHCEISTNFAKKLPLLIK